MGRFLRRLVIAGVAVPGLFVGAVGVAAALPSTAGRAGAHASSVVPATATAIEPAVKEGTRTAILSIDPPAAQSSSTLVTIVASVTGKGAGPAPTGSVTFGYDTAGQASGGPTSGVLGTATLNEGEATFTTSAGELPSGGPQNGSITITAIYGGDHFNTPSRAFMIYFVTTSCPATSWPFASAGFPNVTAGGPEGYYVGQSNGWFTLYVTHPVGSKVIFSGTVTATDGLILDLSSVKDEGDDSVTLVGSSKLEFSMDNGGDLDGFTFYAGCGSAITFQLSIAGTAASSSQIFLGATGRNPALNPVVLVRR